MLATFVPSHRGFPDDNIMAVYSLEPKTRGQCLFTKSFGKYFTLIHVTGECNLQGGLYNSSDIRVLESFCDVI